MLRVLISGKDGYIATHLKSHLEKFGHHVEIIDLLDANWKNKDFSSYDVLIHTSALVHENEKKHELSEYLKVNKDLTYELARKAKQEGIKHFVFFSTQAVYGVKSSLFRRTPITKDTKLSPRTKYGKSKLQAEDLLHELETQNFKVSIIRPPMVIGNGCKGNYNALKKLALKLPVFPKIKNVKSFIYIDNLCEFVKGIIERQMYGTFMPQDKDLYSTTDIALFVGRAHQRKTKLSWLMGLFVKLASPFIGKLKKAFGNDYYDPSLSEVGFDYRLYTNHDAIFLSERYEKPIKSRQELQSGLISIITPLHNCEKYIAQTIESVLAQTYKNFEMIIVDDTSSDKSAEIAAQYSQKDSRIKLFRRKENGGSSAARNDAIQYANGEYICFLDADDLYLPNYLEKQISFLKEHKTNAVFARYTMFSEYGRWPFKTPKKVTYRSQNYQNYLAPLTTLYNRRELGVIYMREDIVKPEDFIYWFELLEITKAIYCNEEYLGDYRLTPNSKSRNKKKLIKYMWTIYHKYERHIILMCLYYMFFWGVTGLKKYRKVK